MNPQLVLEPIKSSAAQLPPGLSACEAAVEQLRQVGRMFHSRGWSLGTSSNYSVVHSRDPLRLVITASGKDKGALQPHDFVLVDRNGEPVGEGQPKSSAETLLHCLLAEDAEVGAILHTHSVWATILSEVYAERGSLVIEDYEMLKGLEGVTTHQHRAEIEIFDNSQDIPTLATDVRQRLYSRCGQVHGFLLRQHGLYTWGRDLFAARRHVEIFEFLFECVGRKLMIQSQLSAAASKENYDGSHNNS
jgi:methylthioribulose-1-phosphate dehydratase